MILVYGHTHTRTEVESLILVYGHTHTKTEVESLILVCSRNGHTPKGQRLSH